MSRQSQTTASQSGQAAAGPIPFEMELKLKDPQENRQALEHAEQQIHQLREQLRGGGSQQVFDELNTLIKAYEAYKKVLARIARNAP